MPSEETRISSHSKRLSEETRGLLVNGACLLGVSLDETMTAAFERLLHELMRWNRKMNLTSISDERSIIVRHFLDSLFLTRYLPRAASLLDIGSGAGFPGIPLKIARPDLEVVLLEATRKKTYFHKRAIRSLHLSGIESIWGRSDQAGVRAALGDRFDVVVSRAVSSLEAFLRDGVHYIHRKGMIVAMRGRDVNAQILPPSLGLTLDRRVSTELPFDRIERHLLFFRRLAFST
jgi:16S rRNA (guanine527-N7)-methyltransferase